MENVQKNKRGMALVLTMICVIVSLGIMTVLHMTVESTHADITHIIATKAQAVNIAQAGLMETINWLRLVASDRHSRFDPRFQTAPVELNETDDPRIGIVREHKLSNTPELMGRYEIRRCYYHPRCMDDPNLEDLDHPEPSGEAREEDDYLDIDPEYGVSNVSQTRNVAYNKRIFLVYSHGFIFTPKQGYSVKKFYTEKNVTISDDASDDSPNYTIPQINRYNRDGIILRAKVTVRAEITQQQVEPPYEAAICFRNKIRLIGSDPLLKLPDSTTQYAITAHAPNYVSDSSSQPVASSGYSNSAYHKKMGDANGKPTTTDATGDEAPVYEPRYLDNIDNVFGVDGEIGLLHNPDLVKCATVADLGDELESYKIYYLGNPDSSTLQNFTISAHSNLKGMSTILYVKGNLKIEDESGFYFTGLLYIEGKLEMYDGTILGCTIIRNRNATSSNVFDQESRIEVKTSAIKVQYNEMVIQDLQQMMGQYTFYSKPQIIKYIDRPYQY